jgi:hypothetical protein
MKPRKTGTFLRMTPLRRLGVAISANRVAHLLALDG